MDDMTPNAKLCAEVMAIERDNVALRAAITGLLKYHQEGDDGAELPREYWSPGYCEAVEHAEALVGSTVVVSRLATEERMNIQEPTCEQCSANEKVFEDGHKVGYAIWYPQMGGYIGKAVALMDKEWTEFPNGSDVGGCFDVLVWHDGEFPFDGEGGNTPRHLHHCEPEQFVAFGEKIAELNDRGRHDG